MFNEVYTESYDLADLGKVKKPKPKKVPKPKMPKMPKPFKSVGGKKESFITGGGLIRNQATLNPIKAVGGGDDFAPMPPTFRTPAGTVVNVGNQSPTDKWGWVDKLFTGGTQILQNYLPAKNQGGGGDVLPYQGGARQQEVDDDGNPISAGAGIGLTSKGLNLSGNVGIIAVVIVVVVVAAVAIGFAKGKK